MGHAEVANQKPSTQSSAEMVPSHKGRSTEISPLSKELVIGLVGYAGAGCSTAARRLRMLLDNFNYTSSIIKLSELIERRLPEGSVPSIEEGPGDGLAKLVRACALQDAGDALREEFGGRAVAALTVREIKELRGNKDAGERRHAYILDSLKHKDEVSLLRRVYDRSFRVIGVHCERSRREERLIGAKSSSAKYRGARPGQVHAYMERDEKDHKNNVNGQQVRDAFYLSDYFVDNNVDAKDGENLNGDLLRFISLLLGAGLVRPTAGERAMYHAHAAALQSSCLSRQVGAALMAATGEILSTGTNDVPKFKGGVYSEDSAVDHRCFAWEWRGADGVTFVGCHNDRRKAELRTTIGKWLSDNFGEKIADKVFPAKLGQMDLDVENRARVVTGIREFLDENSTLLDGMPGIKDLIEYSRSIHAEMNAIVSAARMGMSPAGAHLYCTTYPCHNCARHIITAGVERVFYIEPYVKSLAAELHSDAITTHRPTPADGPAAVQDRVLIVPFTGVGPRMYEDYFSKRSELKGVGGVFEEPAGDAPSSAVRLHELIRVEEAAADIVPMSAE